MNTFQSTQTVPGQQKSPTLKRAGKILKQQFVLLTVLLKLISDLNGRCGMNEACRTDLHSRSASDHELDDVLVIRDAAASYDRDIEYLRTLCDHADGYRLDRRTGITTCVICEHRSSGPDVDTHTHESIDKNYCICAALLGSKSSCFRV